MALRRYFLQNIFIFTTCTILQECLLLQQLVQKIVLLLSAIAMNMVIACEASCSNKRGIRLACIGLWR